MCVAAVQGAWLNRDMGYGPYPLANVGSALMWAGVLHLIFINVVIALIEAIALRVGWKSHFGLRFAVALIANFASAMLGLMLVWPERNWLADVMLDDLMLLGVRQYLVVLLAACFVLTLLVEVPIVLALARGVQNRLRLVIAAVIANSLSCAALAWFYAFASLLVLPPGLTAASLPEVASDPDAVVYWIDEQGRLAEGRLGGGEVAVGEQKLADDPTAELKLQAWADPASPIRLLLISPTTVRPLMEVTRSGELAALLRRRPLNGSGRFVDLQPTQGRPVRLEPVYASEHGLRIHTEKDTHVETDVWIVDVPGVRLVFEPTVILPDGQVVMAYGGRIVLYDSRTKRIAFIAKGRGPVVVPSAWR